MQKLISIVSVSISLRGMGLLGRRRLSRRWIGESVAAVHDVDVETFLRSLGFSDDLSSHSLRCAFCNGVLDRESIGAINPVGSRIDLVCDRPHCIRRLLAQLNSEEAAPTSAVPENYA
ncbi:MAG: hypothetical protein ACRDPE_14915 [Solirubrobacterales bacterium]